MVRHQHGSQHGQPEGRVSDPHRAGDLRNIQAFGGKEGNNPHTDKANKA